MVGGNFPSLSSSFSSLISSPSSSFSSPLPPPPPLFLLLHLLLLLLHFFYSLPPPFTPHLPNTPSPPPPPILPFRRDVLPEVAGALPSGAHPGQELPHREGPWTHLDRHPGTQGPAPPLPPQVSRGKSNSILIPHPTTLCILYKCVCKYGTHHIILYR